jgi:hypothetical protein
MKKLFTLALVLLMATFGYSQVRQVSKNDAKNKVATMQVSKGMESFENVQIEPNMMRTDGELDYTTYDWQSNQGPRTWTIVWPDNKINFGYTMAADPSFTDRGTGIGTYDYNNDEWIPLGGRIENEKTGFGSIARYKENGIVVAAHTASNMGVYIVEDKDNMTPNSVPASLYTNNGSYTHPAVMTSGANRDIIHVFCGNFDDSTIPAKYWRSTDGQSWDEAELVLPFIEECGSDWGTNDYYWMETTEDNCLALVINSAWSDGMVLYSYDDGQTWEKKTFYHHPGVHTDFGETIFLYPRWTSAQWGMNGELCMAYEFNGSTGAPGSGSYYPGIGGVAFWSESLPYHGETQPPFGPDPANPVPPVAGNPFIMDSAYLYSDIYASLWLFSDATHPMWDEYMGYLTPLDGDGNPEDPYTATEFNIEDTKLHGSYNSGCVAMPVLAKVPGSDYDYVAVWSAMDENHLDGTSGNFFYKLFASYTGDGGLTWAPQIQLTTDFMYDLNECVYPQAAVVGTTVVIAVQMDGAPGTYVQSDETEASDNYYQGMTFELNDLFPDAGVGVPEVSHNTHMSVYPNPATDQIGVTLSQNADITIYNMMGQVVMTTEGHAGVNSINISNLTAGIYFVNAGTETQKIVVK